MGREEVVWSSGLHSGARGRGREQDCRSKGRIRRSREAGASREILMLLHKNALGHDDEKDKEWQRQIQSAKGGLLAARRRETSG